VPRITGNLGRGIATAVSTGRLVCSTHMTNFAVMYGTVRDRQKHHCYFQFRILIEAVNLIIPARFAWLAISSISLLSN
jgi:hypothetical protein